jgi:hypothetical protein
MKPSEIRNWLGLYFLLTTTVLGAYILIFGETAALPISKKDSTDAFQIIIPVFVAQLTTVFTWFTQNQSASDDSPTNIQPWMVKAPPLLVVFTLAAAIAAMLMAEHGNSPTDWMDASKFKGVVTFCVTILNATTVLIVTRFLGKKS